MKLRADICIWSLIFLVACSTEQNNEVGYYPEVPVHFPDIPFPDENEWTGARWLLGKKMFFDPIMSHDGKVSCASCHDPALAFSDEVALSLGFDGIEGRSNAPTLTNVAYQPYFTRAGGVPTLEQQVLVPIQEHDEFNSNILEVAERMSEARDYQSMSQEAYGRALDPYVIVRAISTYQRTLISGNSRYDQYLNGDADALNPSELRGMALFFGDRAKCSQCHSNFNFTNYAFENNGLHLSYSDVDRKRLTGEQSDEGKFKVPTLRNVAVTGPYMHDGSLATLADVIDHYDSGGKGHENQSELIRPLNLSDEEKQDLVSFLESLTDNDFISNSNYR